FNPIFESPSHHKYDAAFFHHVDNNFGPDPEGDRKIWEGEDHSDPSTWEWTSADKLFLKLLEEAHNRDMRVIIDGVFNHVGNTFWAFKHVLENQERSRYKEWFTINSFDDPSTDENEFDYEGWYGVKDLPEIREDENGLIKDAAEHVHNIVKRWMDPNNDGNPSDGIDGWRLDVAEMVDHNFWIKFRNWVKDINPNAYITGEIWWEDWQNNKMMNAAPWLQGDQFDAVMNYRFTRAVKHFISDQENQISSSAFKDTINLIRRDYNEENLFVLMNLLGSHDTERLASLIVNPDNWYDHNGNPAQRETFDVRKPNELERMKQKLMVGIQMTMPGAPMVYYGDEAGMWGGDDPDCRKPMVWTEFNYVTETTHPFNKERPEDEVRFNSDLFNWYKKLISIRNDNIELRRGSLVFIDMEDDKVLAYQRNFEGNTINILINKSDENKNINLDRLGTDFIDLLSERDISTKSNIDLEPYSLVILK
ncbi:MAG: glycoside hydrolase family 13 protein, partial [Melioribacteraceae bacterium]|nr:glycoside hydrolase family 13 protein [Melioribacteraceae bacterium]